MGLKQFHWLDLAEYGAIAMAVISWLGGIAAGNFPLPLLLLSLFLILSAAFNGISRFRSQRLNRQRLSGTIKQLHRQWSEEIQTLREKAVPTTPGSAIDSSQLAALQTNLRALEESLHGVVQYLKTQSFPERIAQLETACAQLQQDIAHCSQFLHDSQVNDPLPAAAADPPSTPALSAPPSPPSPVLPTAPIWTCLYTLTGHTQAVSSLGIAPDDRLLASGSWDQTLKVWNLTTGKLLASITAHSQGLLAVVFTGSSSHLATGSFDQSIKLWSLVPSRSQNLDLSLDQTLTAHTGSVHALAFAPDSQLLISGSYDQTVKQWNLDRGEMHYSSYEPLGAIYGIAVDPDRPLIASGGGDGRITLWQLETGEKLGVLEGNVSSVESLAITPDGQTLAAGCVDGTIKFWNLDPGPLQAGQTSQPLRTIAAHLGQVKSLEFSPDGQILFSGGADGQIKLWHPSSREALTVLGLTNEEDSRPCPIFSLTLSSDGQFLAAGGADGRIKIWRQDV